jgi:hypothetical protein
VEHIHHALPSRFDARAGRPCEFCQQLDPQFPGRKPLDQMVARGRKASASAHLSEDGYVRHRVLEIRKLVGHLPLTAA